MFWLSEQKNRSKKTGLRKKDIFATIRSGGCLIRWIGHRGARETGFDCLRGWVFNDRIPLAERGMGRS